jgi:hypothetical protein
VLTKAQRARGESLVVSPACHLPVTLVRLAKRNLQMAACLSLWFYALSVAEQAEAAAARGFALPWGACLLLSVIVAIAATGSIFEYVDRNPIFGVVQVLLLQMSLMC